MMISISSAPSRSRSLRRHALSFGEQLSTFGGFLHTRHRDLERAISMAQEEAATAKRVLFLSRSQQVFHLWHVVHKPFSYTFALLALIHIGGHDDGVFLRHGHALSTRGCGGDSLLLSCAAISRASKRRERRRLKLRRKGSCFPTARRRSIPHIDTNLLHRLRDLHLRLS